MDPADDGFHGQEVVRQGFNLGLCAGCHGDDFRGGLAQADCTSCHSGPGGPTGCTTCHGTPPASGAHLAHATSPRLGRQLDCAECHRVPEVYTDVGHVLDAAGAVDPAPAELTFGTLASATIDPPNRRGPPSIDHGTGTCSNVHCHGDTFGDTAAAFPKPTWTGGPEQGACGACHGLPPSDHGPEGECRLCHEFSPATHVNGLVNAGDPAAGCSRCHGGPENPRGGTFPLGGAHVAHVEGSHRLSAPLSCAECHVMPATVDAPGHLDTALPAEVVFGELARTRSNDPTYTVPPGTCSGVYCHGPAQLSWNDAPPGAAACGTCHGVPPATQAHAQATSLRTCATCHGNVVDGFGNIVNVTLHINGSIDVAR
jgi:predicted CxxxxCH...CXXCH cytochrome family protein